MSHCDFLGAEPKVAKIGSARRWFPPGPYTTNTGTSGKLREANWAVRGTGEDNKRGDRGLDNRENRKGIKRVSEIQTEFELNRFRPIRRAV